MTLTDKLSAFVASIKAEAELISPERKALLQRLATYITDKQRAGEPAQLNFICTHNSRRSHLAQIWAATAAADYGIEGIATYSGGTEATAFNLRAVAALERAGFQIESAAGDNPHYLVSFSENGPAMECFSKTYDHHVNPHSHFAAIMTCSDADENCPFIPGAAFRLSLTYDDPKEADGTAEEAQAYDERVRQIGRELFYAMKNVKPRD